MTVRRGCGICHPCNENQSDMCMTGLFTERGIHKLDGFLTEKVVDKEQYIVKVPPEFAPFAVLCEPISIVEKGIQQIKLIQSRMPWGCEHPEHSCGLAAMGRLQDRPGHRRRQPGTFGHRRCCGSPTPASSPPTSCRTDHPKAGLVGYMEAQYLNAEGLSAKQLMDNPIFAGQRLDVIFEASGASPIAGELIMYMSRSSIYVMTGIPREDMVLNIDTAQIWRQMVRYNQVLVGSVNSNRRHFEAEVADMPAIVEKYPDLMKGIITNRYPLREYDKAFEPQGPEHIKTVIDVSA